VINNFQFNYLKQEDIKMKQKRFKKRLSLNKQTIAQLDQLVPQRMNKIQAGTADIITEPLCAITVQVTITVASYYTYCTYCTCEPICLATVITETYMVLSEATQCPLCDNEGDV
jgi:hypothetical protein